MINIPFRFRKKIASYLKKMLSAVEETRTEYSSTLHDRDGPYCELTVIGVETGLIKQKSRIHLLAN